jgi:hypothetical protein
LKRYLYGSILVCLLANVAWASPIYVYNNPTNGTPIGTTLGPTDAGGYLSTSWIFDEVTPVPGYTGQPMWANGVYMHNTGPGPVNVDLFTGVWAADGAGGGPGTLLDLEVANVVPFGTTNHAILVFTNFAIPSGSFWMGYAFSNYASHSTTAAELSQLEFLQADAPAVGSSTAGALLGSGVGVLGNNPAIASTLTGNTAQFIDVYVPDVPEPSPAWLVVGGVVGIAMLRRRPWASATPSSKTL